MMKTLTIFCLALVQFAYGQEPCIKVDSLIVYYIHKNSQSNVGLQAHDIRYNNLFRKKRLIYDSAGISEFLQAFPLKETSEKDFTDVKMVIDAYSSIGVISFEIDNRFSILVGEKVYKFNDQILAWLKKYFMDWLSQ